MRPAWRCYETRILHLRRLFSKRLSEPPRSWGSRFNPWKSLAPAALMVRSKPRCERTLMH